MSPEYGLSSRLKPPMAKRPAHVSGGASPAEGASYETRPLDASTWDAFAELVERNNGSTEDAGASPITPSTNAASAIPAL
jgi:hypothetical protein